MSRPQPPHDMTWHAERSGAAPVYDDPTERAIDPRGSESLGRRLLRQRMFPSESTPTRIGRYTILRFLGAGGMGQVFAAYDPTLDRKVALKLLVSGAGEDVERRTRLLREAQALAKLSHPNVVQVYEAGEHEGRVFIAMEFVEGRTLAAWLESEDGERASARAIAKVFVEAGRGLAAAHAAKLVHRDFKPANVLLDAQGHARVADFGLVLALDHGEPREPAAAGEHLQPLDVELTTTGTLLGTPAYMAPEQFEGRAGDARTDQFGFCVALYEALTGERPFGGETLAERMAAVHAGLRVSPSAALRLSRRVRRALERGLSADPEQRWPSMEALLVELEPLARWRIAARIGALALPLLGVGAWLVVDDYEQRLEQGAEQLAEVGAAVQVESSRADRLARERELVERMRASSEVGELARTPGRELDAISLGVRLLATGEPGDEPLEPAMRGLALALEGIVPLVDLEQPDHVVLRAAISPSGQHVVTTSLPGTRAIELWSGVPLERKRVELGEFETSLHAPVIAADERFVALGSASRCMVVSLDAGEIVHDIAGCKDPIFAADRLVGERVCKGESCGVAAWSLDDGAMLWSQPSEGRELTLLAHPDGERLLVRHDASVRGALAIHALDDGSRLRWLQAPRESKRPMRPLGMHRDHHVALSDDGRWVVALDEELGERGTLVMWDVDTGEGQPLALQPGVWGWMVTSLTLDAPGRQLLMTGRGQALTHHDLARGPIHLEYMGSSQALFRGKEVVALADGVWRQPGREAPRQGVLGAEQLIGDREGRRLVTAGGGHSRLWSDARHLELDRWVAPPLETILGFSSDRVVTRNKQTKQVHVYDRKGARTRSSSVDLGDSNVVEVAADRPTRVVIQQRNALEFHALGEQREVCRIEVKAEKRAIDPAGTRLAALDGKRSRVRLWDLDACRELDGFEVPAGAWQHLAFARGGALSLRNSAGLTIVRSSAGRLHRIDEQCESVVETGYSTLSPDGSLLLTSCDALVPERGPGRVWDVERGELLRTIDLRSYGMAGQFSRDGTQLVFDAGRQRVAIVDLASGRERLRLPGRLMPDTPFALGEGVLELVVTDWATYEQALVRMPTDANGLVELGCRLLARSDLADGVASVCAELRAPA